MNGFGLLILSQGNSVSHNVVIFATEPFVQVFYFLWARCLWYSLPLCKDKKDD